MEMNEQAQALLDEVKGQLPAEAGPVVDAAVAVLTGWTRDQLRAWILLMTAAPDEAERQLAGAMSLADLADALEALAADADAATAENKAAAIRRLAFWKAALNGLCGVVGMLLLP